MRNKKSNGNQHILSLHSCMVDACMIVHGGENK